MEAERFRDALFLVVMQAREVTVVVFHNRDFQVIDEHLQQHVSSDGGGISAHFQDEVWWGRKTVVYERQGSSLTKSPATH